LTIGFSQISGNTAFGQGGGIFEATITSSGPAAGGPLTIKFSQDLVPAVARAVMNA
jgi:predicted outer membrane repeat protein